MPRGNCSTGPDFAADRDALINWANLTDQVPNRTFGTSALMRNLAARGVLA
jgi:fumarylacetoacetate (FAA) hydrolase family protein